MRYIRIQVSHQSQRGNILSDCRELNKNKKTKTKQNKTKKQNKKQKNNQTD